MNKRKGQDFWSNSGFKRKCVDYAVNEDNIENEQGAINESSQSTQSNLQSTSNATAIPQSTLLTLESTQTTLPFPDDVSVAPRNTLSTTQSQHCPTSDIAQSKSHKPVQPDAHFPHTVFGKVKRSFQKKWYEQFPWLEYSVSSDAVFCFACRFFINNPEPALTTVGFRDWKHATGQKGILVTHSSGKYHTQAVVSWKEYERRVILDQSINCQLDRLGSQTITANRKYVKVVMEAILYCAQQGIAFRGHDESRDSLNPGNFRALINLLSRHCPEVHHRLDSFSSSSTWLSPAFQNEIIEFLSLEVKSTIIEELRHAQLYTVMADESKDISKREQLSIAIRYVYSGKTMERFVGYTLASDLTAQSLALYITDKMKELDLHSEFLVSQCYDGASVMSGCNAGVQTLIKQHSPQAIYVHCCAHRLNLVLVDVSRKVKAASNFFSLIQAVYVFLSSAKTHELFLSHQNAIGGREIRLKKLSDTRWSCRIDSIASILSTYAAIVKTLESIIEGHDRDRAIEASGILTGIKSISFVTALVIYKKIFSVSSNLSDVLQSTSIDLASASLLIESTIDTFKQLRSDDRWELVWEEICAMAKGNNIDVPQVIEPSRRQKRPPNAFNDFYITADTIGTQHSSEVGSNLSYMYKTSVYFATLDVILVEMNDRFSYSNLNIMKAVDSLCPQSKNFLSISKLQPFLCHYKSCLPPVDNIENEIQIFSNYLQRNPVSTTNTTGSQGLHTLYDIITPVKEAFPILNCCLQLALTIGTSTASVERSFSSLRCLKTYLRSTMNQDRLDSLALFM